VPLHVFVTWGSGGLKVEEGLGGVGRLLSFYEGGVGGWVGMLCCCLLSYVPVVWDGRAYARFEVLLVRLGGISVVLA
jgi:hypothetical protein